MKVPWTIGSMARVALCGLLIVLALPLSIDSGASEREVRGNILVPTPVPFASRCLYGVGQEHSQGVTGWLFEPTPGWRFTLQAEDGSGSADFDLFFYDELRPCPESGSATSHTMPGDESGSVPSKATWGLVLMYSGAPGDGFVYREMEPPVEVGKPGGFSPLPASEPLYGTRPPQEDPAVQVVEIEGHDGVDLYVETWLPEPKEGNEPPKLLPTILIVSPYVSPGDEAYGASGSSEGQSFISYMTARGFAVAQHHVRGTGASGGCLEQTAASQIDDAARVIEYLGSKAPWSNGHVGMYGVSYDAETQISVAGLGDPDKTKYLKAIVPVASVGGQYEYSHRDGVPFDLHAFGSNATYLGISAIPFGYDRPTRYPEKASCQREMMTESLDYSGDMREFWRVREYRPGAPSFRAATLWVHGLVDFNVEPIAIAGFFDRIPAGTPKKGLFGIWNHALPDSHPSVAPQWQRADWMPMVTAWFDRYLKGIDTGVEDWPAVQVQSTDGRWREEPDFPSTGGPVGHLALSKDEVLGAGSPSGSSSFVEAMHNLFVTPENTVAFETEPMTADLQITGVPVADLWIRSDKPDGHIAVLIEVLDPDGSALRIQGGGPAIANYGLRSLQHLDPILFNHFTQERSRPFPVGEPVRVAVRMLPTDITVPQGHRLRLTISGVSLMGKTSVPSGSGSKIEVLHDCTHLSALRFLMPNPAARSLNVREIGEEGELLSAPSLGPRDGGGLASADVCGSGPLRLAAFDSRPGAPQASAPDPSGEPAPGTQQKRPRPAEPQAPAATATDLPTESRDAGDSDVTGHSDVTFAGASPKRDRPSWALLWTAVALLAAASGALGVSRLRGGR